MKVFVTGATGFVGSAVVPELLRAGHTVLGLARNSAAAEKLRAAGIEVHEGDIEDGASLAAGARAADGVIHLGFALDFARLDRSLEVDRASITAMADALAGSGKPFVIASGILYYEPQHDAAGTNVLTETTAVKRVETGPAARTKSEDLVVALGREKGFRGSAVRLAPIVHDVGDESGFVAYMARFARDNRFVMTIDGGRNRWSAVHRQDAARLFRAAMEQGSGTGPAQGIYHAVAEQAVVMREIAGVVAARVGLGVEDKTFQEAEQVLPALFPLTFSKDNFVSSEITQRELGWQPTAIGLLEDIEQNYFQGEKSKEGFFKQHAFAEK